MSRSRFSARELLGAAVLILCIAVPVLFSAISSERSDKSGRSDPSDTLALQARIDSAQARSDSIATARARRKALRDSARAVRGFRPAARDRLRDVVSK